MSENLDIICIGESLIEFSTNEGLTYANTLRKYYGGDIISAAVAASRLGSNVGFISRVGNDHFKDFLMDSWQSENIDISNVKLVEGFNGLYFISRLESGEKEFAYYRKKSAATNLSVNDIPPEYIESSRIVYSTGITQSLSISAKEAVKKAFELAKEKDCKVAYDPNFTPSLWDVDEAREAIEEVIEYVDILMLNIKHDAEKLFGISSYEQVIKTFWDKGVSTVVVKLGKEGTAIGHNGEINLVPSCAVKIIDTTGSGDAFNGGFLHGIVSGLNPFESVQLAQKVVSYQIQSIGAINSIPYKKQVYSESKSGD